MTSAHTINGAPFPFDGKDDDGQFDHLDDDEREEFDRVRVRLGLIERGAPNSALIDGRYELLAPLGSGGMGRVHRALDLRFGDEGVQVALKRAHRPSARGRSTHPPRIYDEAVRLAQLRGHPNVVTVFDIGVSQGSHYMTMELVEERDLRRWLRLRTPSSGQTLAVLIGAARGLAAAHANGIVHGDFKPDNVLVGAHGEAKIADFGLAVCPNKICLNPAGSLHYMAPEQFAGEPPNEYSDQFSFCVTAWEALTGVRPYDWDDRASQSATLRHPPLGSTRLPADLRRVLLQGMARRYQDRYSNMNALIEQLEQASLNHRWLKRQRRIALIAGLLVLVAFELGRAASL